MKSQVLQTAWCNISGEAAGEFWSWSLLGVKGLRKRKLTDDECGNVLHTCFCFLSFLLFFCSVSAAEKPPDYQKKQGSSNEEATKTIAGGSRKEPGNDRTEKKPDEEDVTGSTSSLLSNFRSQTDSIPLLGEGIPALGTPSRPPAPHSPLPHWNIPGAPLPPPPRPTAINFGRGPSFGPHHSPWDSSAYGPVGVTTQGPGLPLIPGAGPSASQLIKPGAASQNTSRVEASSDMDMSPSDVDVIEQMNYEFWESQANTDGQNLPGGGSSRIAPSSRAEAGAEKSTCHQEEAVYDPEEDLGQVDPASPQRLEEVIRMQERRARRRDRTFQVSSTRSPYKSCGPICFNKACSNPSLCYLLSDERSLSHSAIFDNLPHFFCS